MPIILIIKKNFKNFLKFFFIYSPLYNYLFINRTKNQNNIKNAPIVTNINITQANRLR